MSRRGPRTSLAVVVADVAQAVAAAQRQLDRSGSDSAEAGALPALAFVVKRTQVALRGTLAVRGDVAASRDEALTFAPVNRVEASLRSGHAAALNGCVSVSIESVDPPHAR